ncbi:precorrin-6Y C5,15-methyltransferase (decarboxylating) [Selenomonas sp. GACV-9]|uniref:precorrin-6y C5,15-methyltransferase (decarboxylating) subunit CbiE n=1 Tax=Selenomonas sp. GACV-9 TaxID=3158782 RepID=UPI0008ECBB28|nr:precorrin-6Y C5,15-methyltransferase (decarboxylating) [Selenomonas ruminantium]
METATVRHKIIVAGIGPGNPDYMVPLASKAIAAAKALVGGKRALAQFAAKASTEQKTMAVTRDIEGVMAFIAQELASHDVVVMVSGDPGYYSLLDALRRNFPVEQIAVIPGISAMQLAFARLALPWHDARLVSFHGRRPADTALRYAPGTVIGMLTDGQYTSKTIPPLLIEQGWPQDAKLHICMRLSYEDEEVRTVSLGEAASLPAYASGILIVEG